MTWWDAGSIAPGARSNLAEAEAEVERETGSNAPSTKPRVEFVYRPATTN